MSSSESTGVFYGWKVVAALFVMLAFSSGLGFYNHSVILQALSKESGFPIEIASAAVSLFFLVSGIAGLFIARLIEKTDVRWVIGVCTLLASVSIALLGRVETQLELFAVYALFGIGFSVPDCCQRLRWWRDGS